MRFDIVYGGRVNGRSQERLAEALLSTTTSDQPDSTASSYRQLYYSGNSAKGNHRSQACRKRTLHQVDFRKKIPSKIILSRRSYYAIHGQIKLVGVHLYADRGQKMKSLRIPSQLEVNNVLGLVSSLPDTLILANRVSL